jgi:aryl-alcohol dehydrogenase-like predicted oxidoreductase
MEQIQLAGTGRMTTRLGFGCSNLMGAMNRKESAALLDAAWDMGIRHFDVAPMYGWGAAESCVGEFLQRHAGYATITTKYGILPPRNQSLVGFARRVARPVIQVLPAVKQKLARVAITTLSPTGAATFSAEEARVSLDRSRKALRTDCIDLWLLHDVAAANLTDPHLLDFMRESVAAGIIGDFGASYDIANIRNLYDQRRQYCRVLQFEWSVLGKVPEFPDSFRIHYRSLAHNFSSLRAELERQPNLRRQWSDKLSFDLSLSENLATLMLRAAVVMNPESIILVSSKSPAHIAANVRAVEEGAVDDLAREFYALVQRDLHRSRQEAATDVEPTSI